MSVGDAKGVVADPRFEGLEFDWLAVDGRGFVAIFSTAGSREFTASNAKRPPPRNAKTGVCRYGGRSRI